MKRFLPLLIILPLLLCIACSDNWVDLNARVTHTGPDVIVYNNDKFDWKEVMLELNDDYIIKINVLPAGSSRTFSLSKFTTRKEGRRFNHNTHRVNTFWINALHKMEAVGKMTLFYRYDWNQCPKVVSEKLSSDLKDWITGKEAKPFIIIFSHSYGGTVATALSGRWDLPLSG